MPKFKPRPQSRRVVAMQDQAAEEVRKERDDAITLEGEILEAKPSGNFLVKLEGGQELLAYLSGKMRKSKIRTSPGDRVLVEVSPYDLTRGRIVHRYR